MGSEEVGPMTGWGTWEELILGGAVLRHGTRDWNVVASELRLRTRSLFSPYAFTAQACKAKYEDLQKRFSGSAAWFEELRKQRVAELKRELAKSEDSIGSLQSTIKLLEAERRQINLADFSSQAESPLPPLNSDGTESVSKETSKDEQSAGSFTKDTGPKKSWFRERQHRAAGMDVKPDNSISSKQDKEFSIKKLPEAGYGHGPVRKRRGQRKRKDPNLAVKEGSVDESDNLGSSNVVSTTQKETSTNDCVRVNKDSGIHNTKGESSTFERENLMEIFKSIAQRDPALVFKHRMDSQKRARYRKVIRQHLDIGTIRSRILGQDITSVKELFRDLLLLANNALVFYSRRTREYKSAFALRHLVMNEYKQRFKGSCHEATSAFIPCNPPVKPRSARPRPRPPPSKDKVLEKSTNVGTVVLPKPPTIENIDDSDKNVTLNALVKGKKGQKRLGKVKSVLVHKGPKTSSPVKQRKKLRK